MKQLTPAQWEKEYVEALKCLYILSEVATKLRDAVKKLRHDYQEDGFPSNSTIAHAEAAVSLLNRGSFACNAINKLLDRAEKIGGHEEFAPPSGKN